MKACPSDKKIKLLQNTSYGGLKMKLPEVKNNKYLTIHLFADLYAFKVYRSFQSIKELTEWLKDEGYIKNRNEYEFYYSMT